MGQAELLGVRVGFCGRAGCSGRGRRGWHRAQQTVIDGEAGACEVSSQHLGTWGPRQPLKASHWVVGCFMQSTQGK